MAYSPDDGVSSLAEGGDGGPPRASALALRADARARAYVPHLYAGDRGTRLVSTAETDTGRWATHRVLNQPPPLADYDPFAADLALAGGARPRGRRLGGASASATSRRVLGSTEALEHAQPRAAQHPGAAHPRPLRQPRRRDRLRPLDALDAAPRRRASGQHAALARAARDGAHVVRACMFHLFNQLDTGPCCPFAINYAAVPTMRQDPALAAEWEERLTLARLRPLRAGGDGLHREAGRLGPARQHDRRRAGRRRLVRADRAQVVLHPPGLRGLLHARPDGRRDHLLRRPAPAPRLSHPAPEGQARRALPGLLGGRVRPPAGADPRRGGPRHGDASSSSSSTRASTR